MIRLNLFWMIALCGHILLPLAANTADVADSAPAPYQRGMTLITPSEQWREALPSGNGKIGALVYGSVNVERVLFNHNELWYGGTVTELPDISAELSVLRQLLDAQKYKEANQYYTDVLRNKNSYKGQNATYHPAFDLLVTTETNLMFENYSRILNFETGESEVRWTDGDTDFSRRLFVSIPDDISVMSLKASQSAAISGEVTLDIHDLKDAVMQNGQLFDPGFTYSTIVSEDGFIEFRADGSGGGEFGGVLRVITKGGDWEAYESLRGPKGRIQYSNVDEVTLIVGFYANEPGSVAVPRLKSQLAALESDYDSLFARHQPLHDKKFSSVSVNLNPGGTVDTPNEYLLLDAYQNPASLELVQKLYDYGRYLLVSGSKEGGYPAGLQGIWNGDYRPPWSGLYGINENLQMSYWQALPGDLGDSMMAFFDYFDAHLDEFRENARKLYGTRGIYIPPFMSPDSGIIRQTAPHVIYWTDAAGWLASFYYEYYLFTGDEAFLEERAVPFLKEVALFYEDFIVKDESGKNKFYPSQSPENQPKDKMLVDPETGREYKIKVQINSTIAVAVSKEVLTNLITACELLDIEADGVKRWKALLVDMPEYEINEDGALKEWLHPDFKDNYEHRHQSHIYPLFPGQEVTLESNPRIYEATRVAIDKRLRIGLKDQTGWSLAHMANVWARLGEAEKARETLNILARVCLGQNLFTYHNDWRRMGATMDFMWGRTAPFQMDANFGIPAAIIEMLCGSNANMLRILPALPEEWSEGSFENMLTRTGVRTSTTWNMRTKTIQVKLVAGRDTVFDMKLPSEIASFESSDASAIKASQYGSLYRALEMKEGETLDLVITLK